MVIHDYLTQRGGAERLVLCMLRAFPEARLVTAIYNPASTFPEFGDHQVETLWPSGVKAFRDHHRLAAPVLASAFGGISTTEDLLCSSSGWSHGARTSGRKVVYCYTPARWLYAPTSFVQEGRSVLSTALRAAGPPLRAWDRRAAASATAYLTSSRAVAARIRTAYGIEAEVLPPPMLLPRFDKQVPMGLPGRYALVVSRLLPYKHVDQAMAACEEVDLPLVIVGSGPERSRLTARAGRDVTFLEGLSDQELDTVYSGATVLLAPAYEDYGLTPLEAAARGVPVVALADGGYLDTVIDGQTGLLYDEGHLVKALLRALERPWDDEAMRDHAGQHSEEQFVDRLRTYFAVPSAAAS